MGEALQGYSVYGVQNYTDYYSGFLVYFVSQFVLTGLGRFIISSQTAHRIRRGKISFNTVLIGSNDKAAELYTELGNRTQTGNRFVGFVSVHNNIHVLVEKNLEHLGTHTQLPEVIERYNIEEVIIAIESSEHEKLENIINILQDTNVKVKMIPDTYDIISGKVKLEALASAPLIEINHELMPLWQVVIKRVFDVVVSTILLLLFSPLLIFSAIMVKFSSNGPIFYKQLRCGENGKNFSMIKFRSMCVDAEKDGPQLSSEHDDEINANLIRQVLERMDVECRSLLTSFYFNGNSMKELAERFGLSSTQVARTKKLRCMKKLGEIIHGYGLKKDHFII